MTELAETVERVERDLAQPRGSRKPEGTEADLRVLLSAARRVMAMEAQRVEAGERMHALIDGLEGRQVGTGDAAAAIQRPMRAALFFLLDSAADGAAARAEVERLRAKVDSYRAALWLCMDDIGGFLHADGSPFIRASDADPNNFASIYAQCEAGKEPRLSVLVSDTFAYACADAEDVEYPQAATVLSLARDEGWPGIIRWVQAQRQARGEEAKPIAEVARSMNAWDELRSRADQAEARVRELEGRLKKAEDVVERARQLTAYSWEDRLEDSKVSDDAKHDARELGIAVWLYDQEAAKP